MQTKQLSVDNQLRVFAVVLDPGEEAMAAIKAFADDHEITGASISAIGAFERATVGWFDFDAKDYRRIPVDQQSEVLSLLGDIGREESRGPSVHLHAVLGLSDGSTRGGHLIDGFVRPTLEIIVTETPAHLHRTPRPELGIALLDLDASLDKEALSLAERSELSPNQAKELIREHGRDSHQVREAAENFKAES